MTQCMLWLLLASNQTLPAPAGEFLLRLEPAASEIRFTLDATMHKVHGTFAVAASEIRFDSATGKIRGLVSADATSGETANAKRDRKMHSQVLRSPDHPEIAFRPTGFDGEFDPRGESRLQLRGTMVLLGREHPIELPVEASVDGDSLCVRGALSIPYVDWGLEDPSVFVLRVGKTVEVELDLRGSLTREPLGETEE